MSSVKRVGVCGSGIMGSGIAEVAAKAGCDVVVREVSRELLDKGISRLRGSLDKAVDKGKLEAPARDAALARLAFLERQPREARASRLLEHRALVTAALKKASPGSTAARRRWRALLEAERAWVDAERSLLEAAAAEEGGAPR